jgi:hypothetical protein
MKVRNEEFYIGMAAGFFCGLFASAAIALMWWIFNGSMITPPAQAREQSPQTCKSLKQWKRETLLRWSKNLADQHRQDFTNGTECSAVHLPPSDEEINNDYAEYIRKCSKTVLWTEPLQPKHNHLWKESTKTPYDKFNSK